MYMAYSHKYSTIVSGYIEFLYGLCTKYTNRKHNWEVLPVHSHVPSPKLLGTFLLGFGKEVGYAIKLSS
jgi:hypothetical protein